jgi:hypothetical protein
LAQHSATTSATALRAKCGLARWPARAAISCSALIRSCPRGPRRASICQLFSLHSLLAPGS